MTGTNGDVVQHLLDRGGWAIEDAQAQRAAHPDTFLLPADEDLARLTPGCAVRLLFAVLDHADPVRDKLPVYKASGEANLVVAHERLWLWVEAVGSAEPAGGSGFGGDRGGSDELVGVVQNLPLATHSRLVPGARVRFRRPDVVGVDLAPPVDMADELAAMAETGFPLLAEADVLVPEDPRRDPTIAPGQAAVCMKARVRPERPWLYSRCLLGRAVEADIFPVFGVRLLPTPERQDCGWAIWAGDPDMDVAHEQFGFDIVEVAEVYERHRPAWNHMALPAGWAFVLGEDGYEDVYMDPEALEE